jgi:lipid-A-disaccharide synthase
MNSKTFMLIAGEASGDLLASELVAALRGQLPDAHFFGAGGSKMDGAGVELAFDMTQHAVVGLTDVLKHILKFRRLFQQLLALAIERKPDVIIGVDFGGFNLRFGHAVKEYVRGNPFSQWDPKIVQFVSPQVWASRPGRARRLEADYDLLLSIFPFEKEWYAQRTPGLRVEFVGHPMIGRFTNDDLRLTRHEPEIASIANRQSQILLLPGSRKSELKKHLEPMLEALRFVQAKLPNVRAVMVLPNPALKALVDKLPALPVNLKVQVGELPWALAGTDVAIASTGTVTMECAFFGVPAVTLYKTSWLTYEIGRRLVTVKSLTMPNLLAGEEVYPEFIQKAATPEHIAGAALDLLQNEARRRRIQSQLRQIIASLGEPGAPGRAAAAILNLLPAESPSSTSS